MDILKPISNGEIQLPDFQRGWVWDDYRIKTLIASMSNSYPIGAVMFLEYGENSSVRFKYRAFMGTTVTQKPENGAYSFPFAITSLFTWF